MALAVADAQTLLKECDAVLLKAHNQLRQASSLVSRVGLSIDAPIIVKNPSTGSGGPSSTASTSAGGVDLAETAGHSNTDHIIQRTDDSDADFVAEMKRQLIRRHRAMLPESRSEAKWDKEKIAGSRRRRIVRDDDNDDAPPEPLRTGYSIFLSQMTAKIRHDRPNEPHHQNRVAQEISKIWNSGKIDKDYYNTFAREVNEEYEERRVQYRATGTYQPSTRFKKLDGANIWVRIAEPPNDLIPLEREISSYETLSFPPRPPELDHQYAEREKRSLYRRKMKIKGLLSDDGTTMKDGRTFEQAFLEDVENHKSPPFDWRTEPRRKRFKDATETTGDDDDDDDSDREENSSADDDNDDDRSDAAEAKTKRKSVLSSLARKNRGLVSSKLQYSGPPLKPLEEGLEWPPGWEVRITTLKSKNGRTETNYYTPIRKYRLRSIGQVKMFIAALKECNGDEYKARYKAGIVRKT
jgi:hypothetical protein